MVPNPRPNDRTRPTGGGPTRPSVTAALVLTVVVLVVVGALAGTAGAATTVVGFEEFDEGTGLTTQYEADGVRFQAQDGQTVGAFVTTCDAGNPECSAARNGQNAAITPEDSQATTPITPAGVTPREPLVAAFTTPQEAVRLYVQDGAGLVASQTATLIARDEAGDIVARDIVRFDPGTGWHLLAVSADSAVISEVVLTLASEGREGDPHNVLVVDDLAMQRNDPPTAVFDFAPGEPAVNTSVVFNASNANDVDGEIVAYRWDLNGDGTIDTVGERPTVTAVFRDPGTYDVTLVVEDDDGATSRFTQEVAVAGQNVPPTAVFDVTPDEPTVGEAVVLDASAANDPDGEIVEYRWDFNADGTIEGVRQRPTLTADFPAPGTYSVALVVVDDDGATDRFTQEMTVIGAPVARCTVSDTEVVSGEQVVIDASGSDAELVRFDVDGDGDFDRTNQANYREFVTYDEAGTVRPLVRAEIRGQLDTSACPTITVTQPPGVGADVAVGGTGGLVGLWVLRKVHSKLNHDNGKNFPPEAAIVHVPDEPAPGRPVLFDGSGSVDPNAGDSVVSYRWTIGDRDAVGPRVVHAFLQDEDHDVELQVVDTHGAIDKVEETVTVTAAAGELSLDDVHPDSPGDDHENLDEEYLVFRNTGDDGLDLGNWTIHDTAEAEGRVTPGKHTFTFPDGFELSADATVTVHTGSAPEDATDRRDGEETRHLYWETSRAIWNNDRDVIVVEDDDGHPVMAVRYTREEAGGYELEHLDVAVLDSWFGEVVVSSREEAPLLSVSLGAGSGLASVTGLVGLVGGATFLRGPKEFLSSWANIAGYLFSSSVAWAATTATGLLPPSIEANVPFLLVLASGVMVLVGGLAVGVQSALSTLREWLT